MRWVRDWIAEAPTAAIAAVLATVVIGAGLCGFAIAELTSGDGDDGGTASAPAVRRSPEAPAVVSGAEQEPKESPPQETAPSEQAAPRARGVPGWPKGLSAHTVVLVTTSDRAAALNVAKEARAGGLEAGLISSDPYNLGTGLWIVYSGRFTTPEGAQAQAGQLAERYPGAYPQLIQSSQ
jgi:hypothetical protein